MLTYTYIASAALKVVILWKLRSWELVECVPGGDFVIGAGGGERRVAVETARHPSCSQQVGLRRRRCRSSLRNKLYDVCGERFQAIRFYNQEPVRQPSDDFTSEIHNLHSENKVTLIVNNNFLIIIIIIILFIIICTLIWI